MATNEIYREANHLSLPVPADTKAGAPVRIGILNGFTETPEGEGVGNIENHASINFEGAFKVDVVGALEKGQAVFIKSDNTLTATVAGSAARFGASLTKKGAGTGPAVVAVDKFGPATA